MSKQKSEGMQVYKRLFAYIKPYWALITVGLVATALSSCVDAGLTWSLKPLLDQGFIAKNQAFIDMLPFYVITAFLLRGSTGFASTYCIVRVSRNVVMTLRQQLFGHLLKLPATYYDNNSSGQLISKIIYNVEQVSNASSNALITIVRESFFIVAILVVMLSISWRLTILFFLTAPVIGFIARYSSKKMRNFGKHLQNGMGEITQIAEEAIEGYRVIRIFGGQTYENNKFGVATRRNRMREMQLIATDALASPAVQMTVAIVIAITVYLATSHAANLTAGGFASILASMLVILKPLKNITTVNNKIQKGVAGAEGVFDLLDAVIEKDTGNKALERAQGRVEFNQLNFTYQNTNSDGKQVLHDINFTAEPGQTVALVGKSGSGKTTLVSLLPHFYDNYTGKITIDHTDIRDIKLDSLRKQFAVVSQHVTLFNDTIRNNIAYGNADISDDQIIAAATAANAMEFISTLTDGLNAIVGENGLLLSGGQRQRLAIARALLKDSPILILDEATSALDTESERHIQSALQNLMRSRTTIVIAHRLSTIEKADKILVLQDGRIIETGTHTELLAIGGEYARLHSMQFKDAPEVEAEPLPM